VKAEKRASKLVKSAFWDAVEVKLGSPVELKGLDSQECELSDQETSNRSQKLLLPKDSQLYPPLLRRIERRE
jgi:hypothetical protein